jgi:predicted RNA-binding Zn-ribbon protein involved in translation (DUF1610 family)
VRTCRLPTVTDSYTSFKVDSAADLYLVSFAQVSACWSRLPHEGKHVHSILMMNCHDCGAGLDDVPVGDPCPKCGSTRRDATVFAHPATAEVVVPTPTIGIGYNPHRPW